MAKSLPLFMTERLKIHTLWGSTYIYTISSNKGVPASPLGQDHDHRVVTGCAICIANQKWTSLDFVISSLLIAEFYYSEQFFNADVAIVFRCTINTISQ